MDTPPPLASVRAPVSTVPLNDCNCSRVIDTPPLKPDRFSIGDTATADRFRRRRCAVQSIAAGVATVDLAGDEISAGDDKGEGAATGEE